MKVIERAYQSISSSKERKDKVTILELGSSFGNSIFAKESLLRKLGVNASYFGVDINPVLIGCSSRYMEARGLEGISLYNGDISDTDSVKRHFGLRRFDVVTSSHLLEHIDDDPLKTVAEWTELAGYALVLSVPFDEDSSGSISLHRSHFDIEKLSSLSQKVKEENLCREADITQIDSGIIIFYK